MHITKSIGGKSRILLVLGMTLGFICLFIHPAFTQNKPNILWLTVEDISPLLGTYGYADIKTHYCSKQTHFIAFSRNKEKKSCL